MPTPPEVKAARCVVDAANRLDFNHHLFATYLLQSSPEVQLNVILSLVIFSDILTDRHYNECEPTPASIWAARISEALAPYREDD